MGKIAQRVFRYSLHILDLSNQLKEEQSQRELEHLQLTHWVNAYENIDDDDIDKNDWNCCAAAAGKNDKVLGGQRR